MKNQRRNQKIVKHEPGTPNPIIQHEEEIMLSTIDKALESTSNAQSIGRNGEIPLRNFFNRYLPYTLRAATGHFIPPSGRLSPQIDVMILDSRYPLLSENADGSVLAMLHSVIQTIEVKTNITTRDLEKMWNDSFIIAELASEVKGYGNTDSFGSVISSAFAYRSAQSLNAMEQKYIEVGDPNRCGLDIIVLRFKDRDIKDGIGIELHFEPNFKSERSSKVIGYMSIPRPIFTPLSDLYYRIVQDSYYSLERRNHTYGKIGAHVMDYMSWASASWKDVYKK